MSVLVRPQALEAQGLAADFIIPVAGSILVLAFGCFHARGLNPLP